MHKSFPFQCIFSASLPTLRKGAHCTKVLHTLTRAVQRTVHFSALSRTMYKPRDEKHFLTIERHFGFPHDSGYTATKRKVHLGPGTKIEVTGKLFF